jgi:hypothetical protein
MAPGTLTARTSSVTQPGKFYWNVCHMYVIYDLFRTFMTFLWHVYDIYDIYHIYDMFMTFTTWLLWCLLMAVISTVSLVQQRTSVISTCRLLECFIACGLLYLKVAQSWEANDIGCRNEAEWAGMRRNEAEWGGKWSLLCVQSPQLYYLLFLTLKWEEKWSLYCLFYTAIWSICCLAFPSFPSPISRG